MLAATLKSPADVRFPIYAQPKIDGHRCYKKDGIIYSGRNGETVTNRFIHSTLSAMALDNVDGELIIPGVPFSEGSGMIRRFEGEPKFIFHVFDNIANPLMPFNIRFFTMEKEIKENTCPFVRTFVRTVPTIFLSTIPELEAYEINTVSQQYEGVILRKPDGPYKQKRSTLREGYLIKWKRFLDDEAVIVGFEEQMRNENTPELNPFGATVRSKHSENLVGKDTLGAFITEWRGKTLRVGTGIGLTDNLRKAIWEFRNDYLGKRITFKYLPHGMDELPRHPVFLRFRENL